MSRFSSAASAGGRARADQRRRDAERRLAEAPHLFLGSLGLLRGQAKKLLDPEDPRHRLAVTSAYVAAVRWGRYLTGSHLTGEGVTTLGEVGELDGGADLLTRWSAHDHQAEVAGRRVLRAVDWAALAAAVALGGWASAFPLLHDVGRARPRV